MDELTVSHNQIQTYYRCPKKWSFAYEMGLQRAITTVPMQRGIYAHDLLAALYSGRDWRERLQEIGNQITSPEQEIPALNFAAQIMPEYEKYSLREDRKWKVLAVELEFHIPFVTPAGRTFIWHGFIDLVVKNIVTGQIIVVDHKTTGTSLSSWSSDSSMSPQLPIYSEACRVLGYGEVTHQIFNVLCTYPYKSAQPPHKLFRRDSVFRTRSELDSIMRELGHTVDEMYRDDLVRRKQLKGDCDQCPFYLPCEMEIKGLDNRAVILTEYRVRQREPEEEVLELNFAALG